MGDRFVLESPPTPTVVEVAGKNGRYGKARHFTDDMDRTLCGLRSGHGPFRHTPGRGATCQRCVQSADGDARFRRMVR